MNDDKKPQTPSSARSVIDYNHLRFRNASVTSPGSNTDVFADFMNVQSIDDNSKTQNKRQTLRDISHEHSSSLVDIKIQSYRDDIKDDEQNDYVESPIENNKEVVDEIYCVISEENMRRCEDAPEDADHLSSQYKTKQSRRSKIKQTFNFQNIKAQLINWKEKERQKHNTTGEKSVVELNHDDDLEEAKEVVGTEKAPIECLVIVNDSKENKRLRKVQPSNYIRSTRYTWWNFIPKNLFEQFRRISNIYFLVTMIVSLIPGLSPTTPVASIIPLALIVLATAFKDAIEDIVRLRIDIKANNEPTLAMVDGTFKKIPTHKVSIGQILKVEKNVPFPADIVLLKSSDPTGKCYVETANLDGESNLKTKKCILQDASDDPAQLNQLKARIAMEKPNEVLDRFQGKFTIVDNAEHKGISVDIENLLVRGTVLKNTEYIIGVVAYVGKETKLYKNMQKGRGKFSHLDLRMNYLLIILLIAQQVLCGFLAMFSALFNNAYAANAFYLSPLGDALASANYVARNWVTFFILLNLIIPMSLFVSLEFIKIFQARLMEADLKMSEVRSGKLVKAQVKDSNLNQELSQLDIIFSDKTGTLTDNCMQYKKSNLDGITFDNDELLQFLRNHKQTQDPIIEARKHLIREYLLCIVLNNTCIPEIIDQQTGERNYNCQSADESALLIAARLNGFILLERSNNTMIVEILGVQYQYEILVTLEFSSERKRSSVVVRDPQGYLTVYTKGADTIMFGRCSANTPESITNSQTMKQALNTFSEQGLRTLVMAKRQISQALFKDWMDRYHEASTSLVNRKYLMGKLSNELERKLQLIGCSAIEDRLQMGVPETIRFLQQAGFTIWMLTGDKTETAVNIAYAANVLTKNESIEIRITDSKNLEHLKQKLQIANQFLIKNRRKKASFALIIDTMGLKYVLMPEMHDLFIDVVRFCKTAVCCRCTPLQKARVSKMVERRLEKKAMAIGDGVNDVSMIQACSVGVGIIGNEGSQAARASDFAIPKFRHLVRLLAVHGHYNYVRNSDFIHLSFYKNMILVYCQILFCVFSGYDGQTLFDSWIIAIYNAVFVVLPPLYSGTFEKDLNEEELESNPKLYKVFKNDYLFNYQTLIVWLARPFWHACVLFFVPLISSLWTNWGVLGVGVQDDVWSFGTITITATIFVVLIRHSYEIKYWTWIAFVVMLLSLISYLAVAPFISAFPSFLADYTYYFVYYMYAQSAAAWAAMFLAVALCILPDVVYKFVKRWYFPEPWEVILVNQNKKSLKRK
ncbi:phospholipid-transporting ATPase ATP8 [Acrasis kona]|uniref:Phospholipid-transporting ATPase n=1 Tax=Acrasis kona TaxID=1008807 RepID=A0AAW2YLJ1_9EUKA